MSRQVAHFTHAELNGLLSHWVAGGLAEMRFENATQISASRYRFERIESGFSGAPVFRVVSGLPDRDWVLKAIPQSVPAERISRSGNLIRRAAEHCDLLAPPQQTVGDSQTYFDAYGFHWELSPWRAGAPLAIHAPLELIEEGGEAIGRVHVALASAAKELAIPLTRHDAGPPRCVRDRIARLRLLTSAIERLGAETISTDTLAIAIADQLSGEDFDHLESRQRCRKLAESLVQARELLTRRWRTLASRLIEQLAVMGQISDAMEVAWVLRDVHRGHLLFDDDQHVRCVLDYDALDLDSPAADLARWSGDFLPVDSWPYAGSEGVDAVALAVAGYRRRCAFSECQYQLAKVLIDANSVGALANWLVWLVLEARRFDGAASRIHNRIIHLIASVCRIC